MIEQNRLWFVAGFGAVTALFLAVGAGTLGGVMALFHLCFLVGAPLAMLVADDLRSRAAVVVVAAALSVAIAAIAVQSLVWFRLASAELIVILATVYGLVLAQLMMTGGGAERADVGDHQSEAHRW